MVDRVEGEVAYTLRYSARARRCRISVRSSGVTLVVPRRMPEPQAVLFLRQNIEWTCGRLEAMRAKAAVFPSGLLLYRGAPARVQVEEAHLRRIAVRKAADGFAVFVPVGRRADAGLALLSWLKRDARRCVEEELRACGHTMSMAPSSISLRDQGTRWGSCSSRGHLAFSWRLILAPPDVLRYVVIHELCHLREMNHGPRFWSLVSSFCPDYRAHKKWLREHGVALHQFEGALEKALGLAQAAA